MRVQCDQCGRLERTGPAVCGAVPYRGTACAALHCTFLGPVVSMSEYLWWGATHCTCCLRSEYDTGMVQLIVPVFMG
jgi:hypothetical protein